MVATMVSRVGPVRAPQFLEQYPSASFIRLHCSDIEYPAGGVPQAIFVLAPTATRLNAIDVCSELRIRFPRARIDRVGRDIAVWAAL